MKSWWESFVLTGHTRRLFLINSDVRKNKQSTDPANYALFYLMLRRGRGVMSMSKGDRREEGGGERWNQCLTAAGGEKINTSRSSAGLFGQEVRSNF